MMNKKFGKPNQPTQIVFVSDNLSMKLGKNLEKLLKERKISLNAFAKKTGVAKSTLHSWIHTGQETVNINQVKKVAEVLGVPFHDLLFGSADPHLSVDESLTELFSGDVRVTVHKFIRKNR